jgi:hypothetical protein
LEHHPDCRHGEHDPEKLCDGCLQVGRLFIRPHVSGTQPNQARTHSKLVSRANILQALASAAKKLPSLASPDDTELRKKVVSRMASEAWRPTMLTVTVQDGTVDLWGLVHSVEQKKAAQLAAETTPGVRAVVNNIIVQRLGSGWS